ncbi:hypothetical protein, partial [[Clostridium] innocuum]|uniref:hypothetical protein n=1 Tax=Clostridium innocuum TaxID=1522 RepID=UPI0005D17A26
VQDADVQDFFDLPSPLIHDDIKGKGKETSSKPIIPPYTTFTHEHDKQSPPVEALHNMYTTRYNMVTKQGYKGLGLGVNEHGIRFPVHIPPKPDMYGVGCSKSHIK